MTRLAETEEAVQGVWLEGHGFGGNALAFDPAGAAFPKYCIFTNEPIEELVPCTIHIVVNYSTSSVTRIHREEIKLDMPVSDTWVQQRTASIQFARKMILIISCAVMVAGPVAAGVLAVLGMGDPAGIITLTLSITAGAIGMLIGLLFNRLTGVHCDPTAIQTNLMRDKSGSIYLTGIRKEYLDRIKKDPRRPAKLNMDFLKKK